MKTKTIQAKSTIYWDNARIRAGGNYLNSGDKDV